MEKAISTDILIVGAGFCGRSVASSLKREFIVIDKGTPFTYNSIPKTEVESFNPPVEGHVPTIKMGIMDANWQSYVVGGNSNWWGGWAARLSKNTFDKKGTTEWLISYDDIEPFYQKAEKILNAHGDKEHNPYLVGEIPGANFWREWGSQFFEKCYITTETKNFENEKIGMCMGRGTCRNCPENAKTMPWHIPTEVFHSTSLLRINYEGNKAVSAVCINEGEEYEFFFNDIVIATGGFENPYHLRSFNYVGEFFQDHSSAEILGKMPVTISYRKIGAESHLEIEDLLINHEGIEIKTIMLVAEPSIDLLQESSIEISDENRSQFATFWLQIEIPPEWNLRMLTKEDFKFYVDYTNYMKNLQKIDSAVDQVKLKLEEKGISVCAEKLTYRYAYGGFHLSGTTSMGKVVDENCKVYGTENVYVAGASVIPRAGGSGPSLTAVALSIRLGEFLNSKKNN